MHKALFGLAFICIVGIFATVSFAADEVAELCFECHTADNNNPDPLIPKLIGQDKAYLIRTFNAFRDGSRNDTTMIDIARKIKDEDQLLEIMEFYSSQPVMTGSPNDDPVVARGEILYFMRRCSNCHGDNGKVVNAFTKEAPVIGGQNSEYLYKTLLELRDGTRPTDVFSLMKLSLLKLSTTEIEAITKYLATR